MPSVYSKAFLAAGLFAVACSQPGLSQAPPVILRIEYENGVRYVYDTVDIPAFATVSTPLSQAVPTFGMYVLLADVVAVNGKPAKGVFLTRQTVVNLKPSPSAGQGIADLARTNVADRSWKSSSRTAPRLGPSRRWDLTVEIPRREHPPARLAASPLQAGQEHSSGCADRLQTVG